MLRSYGLRAKRMSVLILLLAGICLSATAADKVLDLTTPEPADAVSSSWTALGIPAPPPVPFAAEVTLQEIWPINVSHVDKVRVEILLRNTGQDAIAIPVSRKFGEVFKSGNRDERVLEVSLDLTPTGSSAKELQTMPHTIALTGGSADVPGSMISLEPGETLSIQTVQDLGGTWAWRNAGHMIVPVTARAAVQQIFLRSDKTSYNNIVEQNVSKRISSSNTIDMTFAWKE
ncbi:MAG: hypothetical protein M3O20_11325 [Acidobacteriota bacterium]|nr:hypothetical protein [Acidobacteriota bacterium]